MVNENFSVSHSMHYFNNRMWINFVADGKSQKKKTIMKDKQRRWQQSVQWKMQKIMKLISALYSLPLAVATILNSLAPAAADFSVVFLRLFPWRLAAVENFLYVCRAKKKRTTISVARVNEKLAVIRQCAQKYFQRCTKEANKILKETGFHLVIFEIKIK